MTQTVFVMGAMALAASLVPGGWDTAGHRDTAGQWTQEAFHWRGRVARGQAVEIRGVNGDVEARHGAGDAVEVRAVKRGRRDDPSEVEVEVVEHDGGVTICAVYPTPPGKRPNECRPGGGHHHTGRNDVSVAFEVVVPAGVTFVGRTVNGDVEVTGLGGDVDASTVNGSVGISTTGTATAHTVNGSITARFGSAAWRDDLSFETVNGSITITMPDGVSTRVEASTVNGGIETDFPLTIQGRFGPRRLTGTIGEGGDRELRLRTVNGRIELRRGP